MSYKGKDHKGEPRSEAWGNYSKGGHWAGYGKGKTKGKGQKGREKRNGKGTKKKLEKRLGEFGLATSSARLFFEHRTSKRTRYRA